MGSPIINSDTLIDLFVRSVAEFPDRPAVTDDSRSLTYAELDQRSAALAGLLQANGVQAEDRICLYLNRSVELVIAVLGVLRAGAAYVAIDPRYPDARRELMVRMSHARSVVTHSELRGRIGALNADIVVFDDTRPADASLLIGGMANPSGAASVLFTSGSSGTPKPIVLEHRNIVSFARNPSLPKLGPGDRTGQISSASFDAFHFEIWTTLAYGAEIVILPPVPDLLAADIRREMTRRRITAMLVPTMVLNQVVREDPDAFAALRILQVGGDVLLPSTCRDLLAGKFGGELYNLYGPAEITTACTRHRVTVSDLSADSIPIGHALSGVSVRVLDERSSPVSIGRIGELYVGGAGVARGYLDRPDLTAERFVADPLGGHRRFYRTGDLVRERSDGSLDFIGRADNQVKIRGFRVELGEVERSLRRNPGLHDAVVLVSGDDGDRRLVAFVVLDGTLSLKELRRFAESELPEFLVPSAFIALKDIPSSEHGKRDIKALREKETKEHERRRRYAAPVTETERYLANVWEELLRTESVGRCDDFFELGGHSLLAFRVHNRIKRDLGVSLEGKVVAGSSVLKELALAIDAAKDDADLL